MKVCEEGQLGQETITYPSLAEMKRLAEENEQLKKLLLLGENNLEIAILCDLIKRRAPHLLKSYIHPN
ncbi:hypothetical protein [Anoxybacillus ayderensis]|uniref:hypothetical protein n=1 Tax=Anoxybacillus ayderensis TaxID=265546 RepID=UPI0011777A26|nr:hypothetical protein [Anoxybacillus ayderensis]